MKATIITIPVNGNITTENVTDPNVLKKLRVIVGGPVEVVPLFNTYTYNGKKRPCVVFCNEEGKIEDLPVNRRATFYWLNSAKRPLSDVLVGDVAVIIGDEEFFEAL